MPQAVQVEYLISGIMHSGEPLASGQVYFYETDGTTAKTIWNDANKSSTASNPVTLDSNGKAEIFGDGTYTVLIKTSAGSTIQTLENQYFFPNSGTVTTSEIDASSFGAATNATISTAITSASGEDRTVYLNPGNWAISDNLTIPSNINLKFLMGAYVTVANTKTLTIQGTVEGPNYNIFRGDGTVTYDARTNIIPSIWAIGGSHDNLTLDGTVTIKDNLIVNGTTTTINSTVVTIDDPIFTLGGDTAPSSDDNKDRGIEFRYHTGSAAKVGFFGYDDSTQKFSFLVDATNTSETFSGTTGTIVANLEGNVTGTATNATHVTVTDNESTDEDNLITFVEDATSSTGNVGLEMDGNLTYNPSTGRLTATQLSGTLQTAAQANITSVGTLSSLQVSGDATFDTSTLKIDSSNNRVGIGTSSPTYLLDVQQSGSPTNTATYTMARISGANSTANDLTLLGPNTSQVRINFGDENDANIGYISYSHATDSMLFVTNNSERVRINSSGNFLIGTTSTTLYSATSGGGIQFLSNGASAIARDGSASPLYINKTTANGDAIQFRRAGSTVGEISLTTGETLYNTTSDYRLKENVVDLEDALDRLLKLKPKQFNFINDKNNMIDGFLAHEVQEVVHNAVTGEKDAVDEEGNNVYQSIDHSKIIPLLIASAQELKKELDLIKNG